MTGPVASPFVRHRLGRSELMVSALSVGGWVGILTSGTDQNEGSVTEKQKLHAVSTAIETVRHATASGINYFDTAPMYTHPIGDAETLLGLALAQLPAGIRDGLVISTKVGWQPDRPYAFDADSIRRSFERSLAKMALDRVSIVYVHDPRSEEQMVAIERAGGGLEALEKLREDGRIQAIGIGVQRHDYLLRAIGSGRIDIVLSPYDYNLIRRSARAVFEEAERRDVGVVNGSPYLGGLLAGVDPRVAASRRPVENRRDQAIAEGLWAWTSRRRLDLGNIAMQYSLRDPLIGSTLSGPRDVDELAASIRHATQPLPDEVWAELDKFRPTLGPPGAGGEWSLLGS